ncbi:hypothetical protein GCM10023079_29350 [Streptomyces chitinivorans]
MRPMKPFGAAFWSTGQEGGRTVAISTCRAPRSPSRGEVFSGSVPKWSDQKWDHFKTAGHIWSDHLGPFQNPLSLKGDHLDGTTRKTKIETEGGGDHDHGETQCTQPPWATISAPRPPALGNHPRTVLQARQAATQPLLDGFGRNPPRADAADRRSRWPIRMHGNPQTAA